MPRLRAAGHMALTNYLTQTIIGVVWALQLAWLRPWLTELRFGPFEWAWRSATYARRQPLRATRQAASDRRPSTTRAWPIDTPTLWAMNSVRMHERVTADLRQAMRERERDRVAVLRSLLGAIDNAEAVPVEQPAFDPDTGMTSIGVGSTETSRLTIDDTAVHLLLEAEITERSQAADTYRALGRDVEAAVLDRQIAMIRPYLSAAPPT